jgi:ABC-2 type transport system ATP-binding protein
MQEESILSVHAVEKRYAEHTALDKVNLQVPKGSIYGLLGRNGAGKTTLIRCVMQLLMPDAGQLFFDGKTLSKEHQRLIGYLPEEKGLYTDMYVTEHLLYLARLRGVPKKQALQTIEEKLIAFGLTDWSQRKISKMSKGMQQKVQFIAATMHAPQFLILDEPFTGLDPVNAALMEQEMKAFKDGGCSILFSTHRMEQVEDLCDGIALIDKGKNVLNGETQEVRSRFSKHEWNLAFDSAFDREHSLFNRISWSDEKCQKGFITLSAQESPKEILQSLLSSNVSLCYWEERLPSIGEIFVQLVGQAHEEN